MRSKLIGFLFLGWSIGCTPTQDFPVRVKVDARFTAVERAMIASAFETWYQVTGISEYQLTEQFYTECSTEAFLDNLDLGVKAVYYCHSQDSLVAYFKEYFDFPPGNYSGFASVDGILLIMDIIQQYPEGKFYRTIHHEIGHFYGLTHVADLNSIMHNPAGTCFEEGMRIEFDGLYAGSSWELLCLD